MPQQEIAPMSAPPIRQIEVYPGGPWLYVPRDWSERDIAEALAMLRRPA
jgi:hypothetical protein